MNPVARILQTVELLEQIVLHLPMLDIIRVQRVNRHWRDCVGGSVSLQRMLFFTPLSAAETLPPQRLPNCTDLVFGQPVEINPLMSHLFQVRHSERSRPRVTITPGPGSNNLQPVSGERNTTSLSCFDLSGYDIHLAPVYDYRARNLSRAHLPCTQACILDSTKCKHVDRTPLASMESYSLDSWKDMLVCQPPVRSLTLHCDELSGLKGVAIVTATNGVGVTLGDLAVSAAEYQRSCLATRFSLTMRIYQEVEFHTELHPEEVAELFARDLLIVEKGRPCVRVEHPWAIELRCNFA